jgi:hypothetical protein
MARKKPKDFQASSKPVNISWDSNSERKIAFDQRGAILRLEPGCDR